MYWPAVSLFQSERIYLVYCVVLYHSSNVAWDAERRPGGIMIDCCLLTMYGANGNLA